MFVLTIDRRASRRDGHTLDMRAERNRLHHSLPRPVLGWDISAGDELQALYRDAAPALHAVLALEDTGVWHVGLGVGAVDEPLGETVRECTGPAFVAAREAVTAAKEQVSPAVRGSAWAERAAAVLGLVCAVRERRSPAGREAVALADAGLTQHAVAQHLGIAQSSVSRRLRAALWEQEHHARDTLRALLLLADGLAPSSAVLAGDLGAGTAPRGAPGCGARGTAAASHATQDTATQRPTHHTAGRQGP